MKCPIESCQKIKRYGNRYCSMHSARFYRHGNPLIKKNLNQATQGEVLDAFQSLILKTEKCWKWGGYISTSGYGKFHNRYAHRFSWIAYKGEIPKGLDVCHHCDNKICVNPSHLFLGTRKDNMQDAKIKCRLPRGHARSPLTSEQVLQIVKDRNAGVKVVNLAKRFKVTHGVIYAITKGITWSWLTGINP